MIVVVIGDRKLERGYIALDIEDVGMGEVGLEVLVAEGGDGNAKDIPPTSIVRSVRPFPIFSPLFSSLSVKSLILAVAFTFEVLRSMRNVELDQNCPL